MLSIRFQANPFFIRCIKSNSQKIPNKFDDATVVRQVRCTPFRPRGLLFFRFQFLNFPYSCATRACWKRYASDAPATTCA